MEQEVQGIRTNEDSQSIRVDVQVRKIRAWSSRPDHKKEVSQSYTSHFEG